MESAGACPATAGRNFGSQPGEERHAPGGGPRRFGGLDARAELADGAPKRRSSARRGEACPGAVPSGLYAHPAWVAWKERGAWSAIEAGIGVPVLTRALGEGISMAYAAAPFALGAARDRGEERGAALEELSLEVARRVGADCAFIRWDLMAPAWVDEKGSPLAVWVEELRMNAPTRGRALRKAGREGTALDSMVVDLAGGPAAIRSRLAPRARHAVTVAARRGTKARKACPGELARFHALYRETAVRRGFPAHPEEAFSSLFEEARRHDLDLELYIAEYGGADAAAAITARHGEEAWYLFAASSLELREANGPSAILDRALADAAEAGAARMDLLGVAPEGARSHPLAGLSRFKASFGSVRARRAGAWDWVLDKDAYRRWSRFEASPVAAICP